MSLPPRPAIFCCWAQKRGVYCVEKCPSRRQSGRHLLGLSISHFDPRRTFDGHLLRSGKDSTIANLFLCAA
jgi:hypothetical protein